MPFFRAAAAIAETLKVFLLLALPIDALKFPRVPIVEEVCSYLGISKSSFYYKAKHGGIPVIKQGKHLFVYRDELDKWLETGRKGQVPLSIEEEQEQMLAATRHKAKPREL